MNITVRMTKTELLSILTNKIGSTVNRLIIVKEPKLSKMLAFDTIKGVCNELNYNNSSFYITPDRIPAFIDNGNKIAVIKAVRAVVPGMGLGEAKWAVEHWNEWTQFIVTENRYPVINTAYGNLS